MSEAKPTTPSPLLQHTLEQLKSLRLIGLLEAWQEQQAQPTYHDLAFDERFALLVEREYLRRQQQRLQRRLKQATLFTAATLNEVNFEIPRGLKKAQFLQWAQGQWLTQHLSLVVVGPTGVGKTFLACSLADHLCKLKWTPELGQLDRVVKLCKIETCSTLYHNVLHSSHIIHLIWGLVV